MKKHWKLSLFILFNFLTSCENHPIAKNVTNLRYDQIIHQISCEAHHTVYSYFVLIKQAEDTDAFFAYEDRINKFKEKWLSPLAEIFAKNDKLKKALLIKRDILNTELESILNEVRRHYPDGKNVPDGLVERHDRAENALYNFRKESFRFTLRQLKLVRERNRILAKISKMENFINENYPILIKYFNHEVKFSFEFLISETNSLLGNSSLTLPINHGTLAIGLIGSDTLIRNGDRKFALGATFRDLYDIGPNCEDFVEDESKPKITHYPIVSGNIGLKEVFEQYLMLTNRKKVNLGKSDSYTDTITFTTTLDGSLGPTLTLTPATGKIFTSGLTIGGIRKDVHQLIVAIAPAGKASSEEITNVRIIKEDNLVGN